MTQTLRLGDPEDRERLVYILETSLEVRKSSHFFAWTQGPLQSLLPHEILICAMAEPVTQELRLRYFTATRYFRDELFDAACNTRNGLLGTLIRHWQGTRQPLLLPDLESGADPRTDWLKLLHRLELRTMAAHGQVSASGDVHAWFGFFRVPEPGPLTAMLLELLLPCISATYARVLAGESGIAPNSARVGHLLSGREAQVLELVRDGHSNAEIADRLGLSVMTAKNHVQNIRRKLKVKTRGQAVAESIRLGLIRPVREDGQ